ncbi:MAG: hypothetical protein PHC92_12035, partial [Syntrophomonadaceae bacterium]|nr:hypothetical protein [Syntrophomonadaceae bacterium]
LTIFANEEWLALLQATPQLENLFIVSKVELSQLESAAQDALSLEEVSGIKVAVKAAEGEKCERCWIIDLSVGANDQHPTLCRRCQQVVLENGSIGG